MPVTPTGILSEPAAALRTLWSEIAAWQNACGAANAAEAAESIELVAWGDPGTEIARPLGIVGVPRNAIVARGGFGSGRLWMYLECDVAAEHAASHEDAALAFTNLWGAIVEGILVAGEAAGKLIVRQIALDAPPTRSAAKVANRKGAAALQDYMQASAWVDYGIASN